MDAAESIGEDDGPGTAAGLEAGLALELTACTNDGAAGTVANHNSTTVDVFIDVQFLDSNGVLVDTGIGSVSGLKNRQTGEWEASFFGDSLASCDAEVGSVFES
jgi:hypothetical protein